MPACGVDVGVGVRVAVGRLVAVGASVGVEVEVCVSTAVGVGGLVAVGAGVGVEVGKRVAVAAGKLLVAEGADAKLVHRIMALDEQRGPEVVAGAIAFLASDDGRHVNGTVVKVDGGTLA